MNRHYYIFISGLVLFALSIDILIYKKQVIKMFEIIKGWHFPAAAGILFVFSISILLINAYGTSNPAYVFDKTDLAIGLTLMIFPFCMGILTGLYYKK
jgi:hypothetical protein